MCYDLVVFPSIWPFYVRIEWSPFPRLHINGNDDSFRNGDDGGEYDDDILRNSTQWRYSKQCGHFITVAATKKSLKSESNDSIKWRFTFSLGFFSILVLVYRAKLMFGFSEIPTDLFFFIYASHSRAINQVVTDCYIIVFSSCSITLIFS